MAKTDEDDELMVGEGEGEGSEAGEAAADGKKPKTPPMLSVYMGPPDVARHRMANLNKMAAKIGTNRSELIQMIADGRITLTITFD